MAGNGKTDRQTDRQTDTQGIGAMLKLAGLQYRATKKKKGLQHHDDYSTNSLGFIHPPIPKKKKKKKAEI